VRHLCFQRRHPLGILALGAPAPLSPPPDTLGDRLAHRCPENPAQGHGHDADHHHRRDDGLDLVEDEVRVQPRKRRRHGGLDHVDPVRRSPGPSFPASPSRPLASNRSVKSTRSASSATSRRSSSTAATSSSSRASAPGTCPCTCSLAVYTLVKARTIIR